MAKDTDFNFGWNEADNLDPPWGASSSGKTGRASAGTGRRTAQQASAVPASEDDWQHEETCEYVKKQIRLMTETVRKANRMAVIQRGQTQDNGGGQRRAGTRQAGGIQNLSSEHLSTDPKRAKIMGARVPEKWYAVQVKVYVNGNVYFWNLKDANPNLDKLIAAFGSDTDNWTDQEFMLANHIDDWNGRAFPSFIEKAGAGKVKTR